MTAVIDTKSRVLSTGENVSVYTWTCTTCINARGPWIRNRENAVLQGAQHNIEKHNNPRWDVLMRAVEDQNNAVRLRDEVHANILAMKECGCTQCICIHDNIETETNVAQSRKDVIASQLKALQAEMAKYDRFPDEPGDGTVWSFVKTLPHPRTKEPYDYTYLTLHVGDRWYLTGQNHHAMIGIKYDGLIEFIGDAEVFSWTQGDRVC